MKTTHNKSDRGFTLVEIAIVLVIIGLLLGGILKGQELINNAKVRAIAERQNSLKVAWFSFIDRFAALPGDYIQANVYITGAAAGDGDGLIDEKESPLVFQHLTSAGYLRCPQCTETNLTPPTPSNSIINTYGGVMSIFHNDLYAAMGDPNLHTFSQQLLIQTGTRIPSNIIAEVDRKIDDGIANTGDFVFSEYIAASQRGGISTAPRINACMNVLNAQGDWVAAPDIVDEQVLYWRPVNTNVVGGPIEANCGASVYL